MHAKKRVKYLKIFIISSLILFVNLVLDSIVYLSGYSVMENIILVEVIYNILLILSILLILKKPRFFRKIGNLFARFRRNKTTN